jgi:hypothetical protein
MAVNLNTLDQVGNSRILPAWSPEGDKAYPLRLYEQDLRLWCTATDIQEDRRGPTAALRLTGAAKTIVREMPVATLQHGQQVVDTTPDS